MECISQAIVDETWQAVADLPPEDAAQVMFSFSEAQPNLFGFVLSFAEEMEGEAGELCTYLLYVVYQMFANASASPMPMISDEEIETQYQQTCQLLQRLHELDEDEHTAGMEVEIQHQPHVFQYVSDALFGVDDDEPDDESEISEEDGGEIFMMMKCVIDALDEATN